jgi:hypothetical protein
MVDSLLCKYGHDKSIYNRSDTRCGRCRTLDTQKYRKGNGKEVYKAHEARRRATLKRKLYRLQWYARNRIPNKKQQIAELESELERILHVTED